MIKYSIRPYLFVVNYGLIFSIGSLVFTLVISGNALKDGENQRFTVKRLGEQLMDANF